eukprot:765315-Hanusia_phi.AAC.2
MRRKRGRRGEERRRSGRGGGEGEGYRGHEAIEFQSSRLIERQGGGHEAGEGRGGGSIREEKEEK